MPDSRSCTKCGLEKPLESFSKALRGRHGRKSSCKECDAARHRENHVPKPRTPRRPAFTGDEIKTCTKCGEAKELKEFSLSRKATETRNAVYRSGCKRCSSERAMQWYRDNPGRTVANKRRFNLATLYGLTPEQYEAMLRSQGGVCAICGEAPSGRHTRDRRLVVDHCHGTGATRGLLCNRCNRAIGLLKDDAVLLRRAISYLLRHQPG